ncbi:T9SS type A sorting domain-containing protein [Gracilimonas sp.]|uniref:T9SS type A sorting domain-containing protein n=1 Tax=Gracilimonas sp. TaxID=1974203 RepID=UPI003D1366D2
MKKFLLLTTTFLLFTSMSFGQEKRVPDVPAVPQLQPKSFPVHVSDKLNNSELVKRLRAEPSTRPNRNKSMLIVDEEGDERTFYVYNFEESTSNNLVFDMKTFRLIRKGNLTQIWFEVAEIDNGHLNTAVADTMFKYLEEESNQSSFNPNKGIIELSNEYLGSPPNYDGDNLVDFLITDVQDGWSPTEGGGFTAGFFYGVDQNPDPGPGGSYRSNERDVLYIDSYPGIYNNGEANATKPLGTLSHEYQHLIHYNYNSGGQGEITFVNEAQSNFASLLSGYFPHSSYGSYLADTNVPLFQWNSGGNTLPDYGRAASFASYMWDQLGFENSGALTQNPLSGRTGIEDTFSDLEAPFNFEEFLVNWGIANLINAKQINDLYGYEHPFLSSLRAGIDFEDPDISSEEIAVESGAIEYIGFQQSKNLEITVSASNTQTTEIRVITESNNNIEINSLNSGETFTTPAEEVYDKAYIMLVNTNTGTSDPATFTVSSSGELAYDLTTVNTYSDTPKFYWPIPYKNSSNVGRFGFSNQYTISFDALVHSLELYVVGGQGSEGEQIGVKGEGTLRLAVYSDNNGAPGDVLASDSLDFSEIGTGWQTFNVTDWDLNVEQGQIIHVAYEVIVPVIDRDSNSIPLRLDDGSGTQDVTHVMTNPGEFEDMFTDDDTNGQHGVWNNLVLAEAIITDIETESVQPDKFKLSQNYPNPFNPTTNINFSLPKTTDVQLTVYSMLGQKVATLVNSTMPAGDHSISWDAQDMASGLYIYTIQAGDFSQTKKMVLMK